MKDIERACRDFQELLPWLLNRTLSSVEEARLREHLGHCDACVQGLRETTLAWRIHDQHPPAELLVRSVLGGLDPSDDPLIASHLESCATCRDETELVTRSGREAAIDLAGKSPTREQGRDRGKLVPIREPGDTDLKSRFAMSAISWRRLSVAASVAAMTGLAVSAWSWQRTSRLQRDMTNRRVALEERIRSLEFERTRLDAERTALANTMSHSGSGASVAPLLNVPVFELLQWKGGSRTAGAESSVLEIPADASSVVLILATPPSVGDDPVEIELLGPQDHVLWSASGLRLQPTGDYSLVLPASLIPRGEAALALYRVRQGNRVLARTYPLQIRSARP